MGMNTVHIQLFPLPSLFRMCSLLGLIVLEQCAYIIVSLLIESHFLKL